MYIFDSSMKFSSYNSVPTKQNSDVTLNLRKREVEMVIVRNYVRMRTNEM
jgi:hypothetical protein